MSHWTRHFDENGIDYYHNSITNECVWETPEDYRSSDEEDEESEAEYDSEIEAESEEE